MARSFNRLALVCALAVSAPVMATTYPLTITDTSGQRITLQHEPKRIVVQDGRDIMTLSTTVRVSIRSPYPFCRRAS